MMQAHKIFEIMMKGNGYTDEDLTRKDNGYFNPNVQTRWRYFLMGWEMRCIYE